MTPAQQLGPYRLIERIGRGGMGEVWKARDTRLDREVAIKVSAEQFTDRFEREARAIAALNHPNICTLFDVGPNYLVMELIDGPTLADRIAEGPIPLEESLAIAHQIADALEAAHEKHIVHRDLKPANIKLRPDGSVKVLDFGLAKAGGPETVVTGDSPTMLHTPTQMGVILGTAAYMAPEQARGKNIDKRADIWAFGVVLCEMVTGKRVFEGEDLTETLASVVKSDPDLTPVPQKLRRLIAKCLQKDPKKRLRDIGDAWDYLDDTQPPASAREPAKQSKLWPVLTAALTIALAALTVLHFRETPPVPLSARFTIAAPLESIPGFIQLAPDGRRMVLALVGNDGGLHLRSIDSEVLTPISGTEGARAPVWSSDGRFIAFFASGKLKIAPAGGGPVQTLCDADGAAGGIAWSRDGTILYNSPGLQLWRTTAAGGSCAALSKADYDASVPTFLPDGRHFFYVHAASDGSGGVYLADLSAVHDGNLHGRRILADISSVSYAPAANGRGYSHLLFLREHSLMAQPFNDKTLEIAGEPDLLADRASFSLNTNLAGISASSDGTIVYLSGLEQNHVLTWLDRTGKEIGKVGGVHEQQGVTLSPNGNYAVSRRVSSYGAELWLYDLVRNSERRLAPLAPRGSSSFPVWSPDGASAWVYQPGADGYGIYQIDVATGAQKLIEKDEVASRAMLSDRSRDGGYFVFTVVDPKTLGDIWSAPVESGKPGKAIKLVGTPGTAGQAQISPDGKWLAYYSDESGHGEIYVRPFPEGGETWKVSTSGVNREPRWRADSRELFYLSHDTPGILGVMSVAVEPEGHGGLHPGPPQKLFEYRSSVIVIQANTWSYSPSPDGKRFLANVLARPGSPSVKVILNWREGVKE